MIFSFHPKYGAARWVPSYTAHYIMTLNHSFSLCIFSQCFISWYFMLFCSCSHGPIGKQYLCQLVQFLNRYWLLWCYLLPFSDLMRLIFQFRLSSADMERLDQATTQEAHKQIFEELASNLPVLTRNPQSGRIASTRNQVHLIDDYFTIFQWGIARNVYISSQTEATIAVFAVSVSQRWITTAHGLTTV